MTYMKSIAQHIHFIFFLVLLLINSIFSTL